MYHESAFTGKTDGRDRAWRQKGSIIEDARIEELSFGNWEGIGCRPENYAVDAD